MKNYYGDNENNLNEDVVVIEEEGVVVYSGKRTEDNPVVVE